MGSNLPSISGDDARAAFEKDGWVFNRQSSSHMIMKKQGTIVQLSVPRHKTLKPGTLRVSIRNAARTLT